MSKGRSRAGARGRVVLVPPTLLEFSLLGMAHVNLVPRLVSGQRKKPGTQFGHAQFPLGIWKFPLNTKLREAR